MRRSMKSRSYALVRDGWIIRKGSKQEMLSELRRMRTEDKLGTQLYQTPREVGHAIGTSPNQS